MKPPQRTTGVDLLALRDARRKAREQRRLSAAGGAGGRAGLASPQVKGRNKLSDRPQPMPEPSRGVEMVPFDQTGPLTVAESNNYPVRIGGVPFLVVTLTANLSAAGEITLKRNGSIIATEVLATADPVQTFGPYEGEAFAPYDLARLAITDAGTGGEGFHAELWLS